jgi:fatty acid desaturase
VALAGAARHGQDAATESMTDHVSPAIMSDPRVRSVLWRDLAPLSRWEAAREIALPLPWLAAELALHANHHHVAASAAAFMFFLACLRVAHDLFHRNLGLHRRLDHVVLMIMSPFMLTSLHAIRVTHLRHHTHCMNDDDAEAASARTTAIRALALGPLFAIRTHLAGVQHGTRRERTMMGIELLCGMGLIAAAVTPSQHSLLGSHVVLMAIGQMLAPFFAVWTVHHDCDRSHYIARTLRNRCKSFLVLDMFFHVEHHLFPRVPTKRLPMLAERLDRAAPELATRHVF